MMYRAHKSMTSAKDEGHTIGSKVTWQYLCQFYNPQSLEGFSNNSAQMFIRCSWGAVCMSHWPQLKAMVTWWARRSYSSNFCQPCNLSIPGGIFKVFFAEYLPMCRVHKSWPWLKVKMMPLHCVFLQSVTLGTAYGEDIWFCIRNNCLAFLCFWATNLAFV